MPLTTIPGFTPYVDFTPLGELPKAYWQGQEQSRANSFRDALRNVNPTDYNELVATAARYGMPEQLAQYAKLGMSERELASNIQHQRAGEKYQRDTLAQSRQHQLEQTAQTGWQLETGPDGKPRIKGYVAGGPADPDYITDVAEGKQRPRDMSVTD